MASFYDLWLTPTLTLSLILEAEAPAPSLFGKVAGWLLWVRPRLVKEALQYELEVRGGKGDGEAVVGAGTLRVVDYGLNRETDGNKGTNLRRPAAVDHLTMSIADREGIDASSPEHDLLHLCLSRVLASYALIDRVADLAGLSYPQAGEDEREEADRLLRELWEKLRPEKELPELEGKHWQEIGFQNTHPATDLRKVGLLGLYCVLHFAKTYGDRAAEIVDESVGGGEHWYPLALASLHMTAFALELAESRDLQLFLLRSFQTSPASSSSSPDPSSSASLIDLSDPSASLLRPSLSLDLPTSAVHHTSESSERQEIEPFLRISSDLLLLFHAHWQQGGYSVMNFEQVSKSFQAALRPWIRRGVLDGRHLGWEKWDEGTVKLE
ncbi:hypothetical protein JCM8547_001210 [Rhodosporidiobolus lusitaniae]